MFDRARFEERVRNIKEENERAAARLLHLLRFRSVWNAISMDTSILVGAYAIEKIEQVPLPTTDIDLTLPEKRHRTIANEVREVVEKEGGKASIVRSTTDDWNIKITFDKGELDVGWINPAKFKVAGNYREFYDYIKSRKPKKVGFGNGEIYAAPPSIVVYMRTAIPQWQNYMQKNIRDAIQLNRYGKKFDILEVERIADDLGTRPQLAERIGLLRQTLKERGLPY